MASINKYTFFIRYKWINAISLKSNFITKNFRLVNNKW